MHTTYNREEDEKMPIYIVKCESCKALSEMILKFAQVDSENRVSDAVCPECGEPVLTKQPSLEGGSFHLKGKWFKTTKSY